jgi:hypothetical protein
MKLYASQDWKCFCGNKYFFAEGEINYMTCLNRDCNRYEKTVCSGCESDLSRLSNHYC